MNMDEKELKNRILKEDDIVIPESLMPENMEKKLREMQEQGQLEQKKVRSKKRYIYSGAVAAAALVICISAGVYKKNQWKSTSGKTVSKTVETVTEDNKEEAVQTNNYEIAYVQLAKYYDVTKANDKEYGVVDTIRNSLEDIFTDSRKEARAEDMVEESADLASESKSAAYSKTNTRTTGVEEGDVVKTDGEYIYEYDDNNIFVNIYKVEKEDTKLVSEINLNSYNMYIYDMYVSDNRLVIVGEVIEAEKQDVKKLYQESKEDFDNFNETSWCNYNSCDETDKAYYTRTLIFDISDRKEPELLQSFFQDGDYLQTRLVNQHLYVFSDRTFNVKNIDKEDDTSYIPQISGKCVEDFDVAVSEEALNDSYTVMAGIDIETGEYTDRKAMLGGGNNLYVSSSNIYLIDEVYGEDAGSVIQKYSYENGVMTKQACGKVIGYAKDDYALDEKDGYLRVVTTYTKQTKNGIEQYNGLFVLDKDMKQTGCVKNLAKGEEIYSARFIGNTAYFVTYRNTDPLFAVDMSNLEKPKVLGYLKIPGFSNYLHPYNDHLLLGIGMETDENGNSYGVKLSMFDISNPADIKEVDKEVLYEYEETEVNYNPNALMIDTEKNIFGFAVSDYDVQISNYMVYSYDEKNGFQIRLNYALNNGDDYEYNSIARGLYIGKYFYVVSVGKSITSFDLETFKKCKINEEK